MDAWQQCWVLMERVTAPTHEKNEVQVCERYFSWFSFLLSLGEIANASCPCIYVLCVSVMRDMMPWQSFVTTNMWDVRPDVRHDVLTCVCKKWDLGSGAGGSCCPKRQSHCCIGHLEQLPLNWPVSKRLFTLLLQSKTDVECFCWKNQMQRLVLASLASKKVFFFRLSLLSSSTVRFLVLLETTSSLRITTCDRFCICHALVRGEKTAVIVLYSFLFVAWTVQMIPGGISFVNMSTSSFKWPSPLSCH